MAKKDSIQKKIEKVRPPRVNITYEVETGDAIEVKELPFVMGVLGNFSGQPSDPQPKLKDRKFVEVTPDNFDDVMSSMKPHLSLSVENRLTEEEGTFRVDLDFESLDDFAPDRVARQVEPLKELLDLRDQLADLRGKLQGNDQLEEILQATVSDAEKLERLKEEIGSQDDPDDASEGADEEEDNG